jgi:CBS domain-containing protein
MEDIFVARLMTSEVTTLTPESTVQEAANILRDEQIGSLVIVDGANRLQGIITGTDFICIVGDGEAGQETAVGDYMTENVVTVNPQDFIQDAADKMITYGIQHLPVEDEDEGVVGMLSATDLTAYISDVEQPSPL